MTTFLIAVATGWFCLTVGFLFGAFWASAAAFNRQVEDSDHARFERDQAVRDEAELADAVDDIWGQP